MENFEQLRQIIVSSNATYSLEIALYNYQNTLNSLDNSKMTKEDALTILKSRDKLQAILKTKTEINVSILNEIIKQDERLKAKAYKIVDSLDLSKYRESLPNLTQEWWWNLDLQDSSHLINHYDPIWKGLRVIVWTSNLALLGTLFTRFLSSSSGVWEVLAIAFPSVLSLLQAQSELTDTGRKKFEDFLSHKNIKPHWYEKIKLGVNFSITLLLLVTFFQIMPACSEYYKNQGKNNEQKKLALAEKNYLKAIDLNPENLDAHYRLANLYANLQDFDNARKHYIIAAKGGNLDAYNDLAYWNIRQNKPADAVELLENQGLKLLDEKFNNKIKISVKDRQNLESLKYSIYKNLGWAKLEQKRYDDAKKYLEIATSLADDLLVVNFIRNPGAAYCLSAQVLEKEIKDKQQAKLSPKIKENWQKCQDLITKRKAAGNSISPEEDTWLNESKQRLK